MDDEKRIIEMVDEEFIRDRIRQIIGKEQARASRLAEWTAHPLASVIVGFVLTGVIGWGLTTWYGAREKAREQELSDRRARQTQELADKRAAHERDLADRRAHYETSTRAVQEFSRTVYERYTGAMLLQSALMRPASSEEIERRKLDYDRAFAEWSTGNQANLFMIRKVMRRASYTEVEAGVEFELVPILREVDACLTRAYDTRKSSGGARAVLTQCDFTNRLQQSLDCSYHITNRLFEVASLGLESDTPPTSTTATISCAK